MYKRKGLILVIAIYIITLYINTSASNINGYNYRNQLTDSQKKIYDLFVDYMKPNNTNIDLTNIYNSKTYTEEEFESFGHKLSIDTQVSLDAFLKDYPEVYWLKFGEGGVGSSYSYTIIGKYITVKKVTFKIVVADKYAANVNSLNLEMQKVINEFNIKGNTRYDKVKSIHDQLIELITYESDFEYAHEPVGALLYNKAVCEGYAEAFKLLCDREGIPSVIVIGTGVTKSGTESHMWNYVQMEDSKWYAVDVTWDNQTSIYYDFFLVGSTTKDKYFGGKTFSESHILSGDFSGTGKFSFTYPTLSQIAYIKTEPTPTVTVTPTLTASPTATVTPTISVTPIGTVGYPTGTPTNTITPKPTLTVTVKPTNAPTPTITPTGTVGYPTGTEAPSGTEGYTATPTGTVGYSGTEEPNNTIGVQNVTPTQNSSEPYDKEGNGNELIIFITLGFAGLGIIYIIFKRK